MAGNRSDFMAKFRSGFNKTSKDEEALKMQEEAQERARKKREEKKGGSPSLFNKIRKMIKR